MLVYQGERIAVWTVDAGRLRLDGGAMFGVVPKPLWERRIEADDRNRIPLAMRCLYVEAEDTRILVDTGVGDKEGEKFRGIYGIENDGKPTRLHDSLRELDVAPEDIDMVVNTHLHFDHAGGNTVLDEAGEASPAFPNARYVVRRGEWEFAHRENERIQASYLQYNFDPLEEAGVLELVDEDREVAPGVRLVRTPGHTPHHQSILLGEGEDLLFYLADLVPTTAHVSLPWIMGFDVEPLETLETKREMLNRAGREGWVLLFEHDPEVAYGWAKPVDGDGCELASPVTDDAVPLSDGPDDGDGPATG